MEETLTNRKTFYQVLTQKIRILILVVSFAPMVLTTGILFYRFNLTYMEKVKAHISELVLKHTQNIDTFLSEKLRNIRYLALHFELYQPAPAQFLKDNLKLLKQEYGDVFTDLGLVNDKGIQFAYEGPFKLENADYSNAPWFIEALGKAHYISDVFAGLRGHPHFIVAVKVKVGHRVCILRATINFAAFNSLVENIQIGKTGVAYIVNNTGEPQTKTQSALNKSILLSLTDRTRYRDGRPVFSIFETISGQEFICITAILKNINWIMIFRQDHDDAFRDLWKTQMLTLVIFSFSCAAILSVAFALPRNIVALISNADQKNEAMNKQVVESGKLATIGELAAGIAHEINNPVAIMVEEAGWIEDLLEEEVPEKCKNMNEYLRALKQIHTQGNRCKEITHKLLSFARKTDSTINDVNINDSVKEIVSLTGQMAKYNNVSIKTELQADLPLVRISPSEIQQVILNLINNAIDAMKKDGGTIRIETRSSQKEKNHLILSIEDNGPGIPKNILDRIFDPFFTTKPVGKGTGLGLSICYGIIQKMAGKIDVYSQVGVGTKFHIFIPFEIEKTIKNKEKKNESYQTADGR